MQGLCFQQGLSRKLPRRTVIDTGSVCYLTPRCFDLDLMLVLVGDRTRVAHYSASDVAVKQRAAHAELCDLTQGASGPVIPYAFGQPRAALGAL
jgi:hypothetical protein